MFLFESRIFPLPWCRSSPFFLNFDIFLEVQKGTVFPLHLPFVLRYEVTFVLSFKITLSLVTSEGFHRWTKEGNKAQDVKEGLHKINRRTVLVSLHLIKYDTVFTDDYWKFIKYKVTLQVKSSLVLVYDFLTFRCSKSSITSSVDSFNSPISRDEYWTV